jgi:putative Mg2+ transporter-C (MgtC) family protein
LFEIVGINLEDFFNWPVILKNLILIIIALLFTLPLAINRESHSKGAGLRTYPLVAIATCSYTLLALEVLGGGDGIAKFMAGLVTGIGFIGGGAIMKSKDEDKISGLANAASIWNTGAVGMAVAWQRFEIAMIISIINYFIFRAGHKVKKVINEDD